MADFQRGNHTVLSATTAQRSWKPDKAGEMRTTREDWRRVRLVEDPSHAAESRLEALEYCTLACCHMKFMPSDDQIDRIFSRIG